MRSAAPTEARAQASPSEPIVQAGKNCWRVERAHQFYCIQDAADYFALVRQALLAARKTVFILGWDIFAAVDLLPAIRPVQTDRPYAERRRRRLDELLAFIARRRPQLRCYILIWDYAALYTLERDPWSRWRLGLAHASPRAVRLRRSPSSRRLASPEDRRRGRPAGLLRRHRSDQPSLGHERPSGRRAGTADDTAASPTGRITKSRRW